MSTDPKLIELVARALCKIEGHNPDCQASYYSNDKLWTDYAEDAQKVIAAYEAARGGWVLVPREPTKEMLLAGNDGIDDDINYWNYDSGSGYTVEPQAAYNVWARMIAAAKGE